LFSNADFHANSHRAQSHFMVIVRMEPQLATITDQTD